MAAKTFVIELRVDHDMPTEEKDKVVQDAVMMAAKQLLATAMLVQDKRKPQIAVQAGDMFAKNEDVELLGNEAENPTPIEGEEVVAPEPPPLWEENASWAAAHEAEYSVGQNEEGWRYNDPSGNWSRVFGTPEAAWDAAAFHHHNSNLGGN